MDGYRRGGHAKYSLKAHLIFVTKYRRPIFNSRSEDESIKELMHIASDSIGCRIIQMETNLDHIHILIDYSPDQKISDIVKHLKQYTTYYMWQRHSQNLIRYYWKKSVFWSDGYFACSIGQVSQDIIEKYIQNQG